jgi:hypothetical protein
MKLSDLKYETRQLTVDIEGQPLRVEYFVNLYTPELEADILAAENQPAAGLAHVLGILIKTWDLEDEDGQIYPLTGPRTSKLPLSFMLKVLAAIGEDMRPNAKTARG